MGLYRRHLNMLSFRHQCLALFGLCVCLIAWQVAAVQNTSRLVCVLLLLFIAALCLDIYRLKPSPYHTYKTLFLQYATFKLVTVGAIIAKPRFENSSFNVKSIQNKTLMKILKNNAGSVFSKKRGIDKITTVDEFRKTVPLSTYEDYLPYITRAVEGETNIFYPQQVGYIATTTGTTSSESKKYPKSYKLTRMISPDIFTLFAYSQVKTPGSTCLQKYLWYGCTKSPSITPSGVKMGPISSMFDISTMSYMSTPKVAAHISREEDKSYIDLLFGVRDETIMVLNGCVSPLLLKMFKSLERHWRTLCDDIERGTLYSGITIDDKLRAELESLCRPDPIRASKLRQEFEKGFDGIVPRIWPNCKLVLAISSGTFQVYADYVKEKYLGGVILFSKCHGSTEGILGVNLWPEWSEHIYAPIPGVMFYEWLPVDEHGGEPVQTHEVELGKEYEMVITTLEGLYRYRTEDIVRFTKRHYHLPVYEFVRRKGDVLNIYTEKVPESLASQALLETFADTKGVDIVDYTFVEFIYYEKTLGEMTGDMYYGIFVEADGETVKAKDLAQKVDEKLCKFVPFYGDCREKGTFSELKIFFLRSNTFAKFKARRLTMNKLAGSMQFKVPRIIRDEKMIGFFEDERRREI